MNLATILPTIFSGIFLVGGYLYVRFYYDVFDISVANFFSISDYIRSSVDHLFKVLIASVIPLASGVLIGFFVIKAEKGGVISRPVSAVTETEPRHTTVLGNIFRSKLNIPVYIIVGLYSLVTYYYSDAPERYMFLYLGVMLLWISSLPYLLKTSVGKQIIETLKGTRKTSVILLIPLAFLYLYSDAKMAANTAKQLNPSCFNVSLIKGFVGPPGFEEDQLVFVGSNSDFYFLFQKQKNVVFVIPSSQMSSLSIEQDCKPKIIKKGHIYNPIKDLYKYIKSKL